MKVLLLGGTTEAAALARALAGVPDIDTTLSLAGRTKNPASSPLPTRVGGFGGAAGLQAYLAENAIDLLIDATHPYAAQIAQNAAEAAAEIGLPMLAVRRPPWEPKKGDRWQIVSEFGEAADLLGAAPRRVFLALGRLELDAFAKAPQHDYLIRSVDHPGPLPMPNVTVITARGPFDFASEEALLRKHGIEVLVCKNSGGNATYGKIEAARKLGLPVLMLVRPSLPWAETVETPEAAMAWLRTRHEALARRGV